MRRALRTRLREMMPTEIDGVRFELLEFSLSGRGEAPCVSARIKAVRSDGASFVAIVAESNRGENWVVFADREALGLKRGEANPPVACGGSSFGFIADAINAI